MSPEPDYGYKSYKGSGKLTNKVCACFAMQLDLTDIEPRHPVHAKTIYQVIGTVSSATYMLRVQT